MKCIKCGLCCSQLSLGDRFAISFSTKTFMNKRVCRFLDKNHLCRIYDKRPKICKNWKCGISKL